MRTFVCFAITLIVAACASSPAPAGSTAPAAEGTAGKAASKSATPALSSPHEVLAADLVDHLGDSIETAVTLPVDVPNEGVDFQNRWIYDHFGRFRRKSFAMGHAPGAPGHERHYDVISFELPDGSVHTVYFDMTDFWAHAAVPK
ncbi:MAG: hypothetical protein ABI837_10945 [Acidobacteriota bacterium]